MLTFSGFFFVLLELVPCLLSLLTLYPCSASHTDSSRRNKLNLTQRFLIKHTRLVSSSTGIKQPHQPQVWSSN